jgi:hypothetical protein
MKLLLLTLITLALAGCPGCSPRAPATPSGSRPSLDATNPDERIDAAKDAAKKYGGAP